MQEQMKNRELQRAEERIAPSRLDAAGYASPTAGISAAPSRCGFRSARILRPRGKVESHDGVTGGANTAGSIWEIQ